jgi:hypothetical protein
VVLKSGVLRRGDDSRPLQGFGHGPLSDQSRGDRADEGSMMEPEHRRGGRLLRRFATTVLAVVLPLAVFAPMAKAGILVSSAQNCPEQALEQPFAPWGDPASYVLVPQGTLEATSSWALSGASDVDGNEPFFVHGAGERYSLSLPAGSAATTPTQCVGLAYPTLRFFARNTGSPLSVLNVTALIQDNLGLLKSVPIGVVTGTSAWAPTLPMPIVASLLPLLPGSRTPVRFRFKASGGPWQIDDVYVDPYRAG